MDVTTRASTSPRHWGLVGTALWSIAVGIVFFGVHTVVRLVYVTRGRSPVTPAQLQALLESSREGGMAISLATVASSAICVPLVLAIVKLKRGSGLLEALALRAVPLKTLFQWLGIAAAFILASDALTVALHRPIVPKSVEIVYVSSPAWISWPAVLLCAPLLEELFFRGFLFKGLEGAIRPVTAIFVTAACWPIFHLQYDFYDIGTIFVFGLVLGAARSRTGSIAPTLAMHALINLVGWSEAAVLSHRVVA